MLKIRLRRQGSHARPFYRVVVSDQRKRPEGRVLAEIGHYDPMKTPKVIDVDLARWEEWVAKGAQPSETIRSLVAKQRRAEAAGISLAAPAASSASARKSAPAAAPVTAEASATAVAEPSAETGSEPSATPSADASAEPSADASAESSADASAEPSAEPSGAPGDGEASGGTSDEPAKE